MTLFLDASVLVALFTDDPLSARADGVLQSSPEGLLVSDFAAAEYASAIGLRVRTGQLEVAEAQDAFADFDAWSSLTTLRVEVQSPDISTATALLRRLDLTLRAPDALNIVVAQRLGAALATFDVKMATCARRLGLSVWPG